MKTSPLVAVLAAFCVAHSSVGAAIVQEGSKIDEVSEAMSKAGYEQSGLDMLPRDRTHRLAFWAVDEGVLIVLYSTESKRVISVSFWLSDERPKATRQTFELKVTSFDTDSGVMVVQAKSPKRERGVAPQSATHSESDSEGGNKPQTESEPRPR